MWPRPYPKMVTNILSLSLFSCVMPSKLKEAILSPLIKKLTLDTEILKNFLPVSNLAFISQLIERVVASGETESSETRGSTSRRPRGARSSWPEPNSSFKIRICGHWPIFVAIGLLFLNISVLRLLDRVAHRPSSYRMFNQLTMNVNRFLRNKT